MSPHTDHRLDNRVAVITGAAGGIGGAVVERIASLGAIVVLLELRPELVMDTQSQLTDRGVRSLILGCDVTDASAVAAAAQRVEAELGRCDILVNNAGILAPANAIANVSLSDWNRTLMVNLTSVFLTTQAFGALMLAQGKGSIVNIGSVAAVSPNGSPPYGVSKAGVLAFTRHTAIEWGPRGIRANTVSPGFVRTPLSEPLYAADNMLAKRTASTPLRRIGLASDIAAAVGFLASDNASFVSGQDLIVDGGFTLTTLMQAQRPQDQYGGQGAHPALA